MIRSALLGLGCLLGTATLALAQPSYGGAGGYGGFGSGYGNTPNVMPNIYNPRTQPLSPYLNLLRGGNPGVNYYYGVRPGTTGGAGSFGPGAYLAPGGSRAPYFNVNLNDDPSALNLPESEKGFFLPPAGHPVVYGNTLGYFPGGGGGNRGMGGIRPGVGSTTGGAGQQGATPRR